MNIDKTTIERTSSDEPMILPVLHRNASSQLISTPPFERPDYQMPLKSHATHENDLYQLTSANSSLKQESIMCVQQTPCEILSMIKEKGFQTINLSWPDEMGLWHHVEITASELTFDSFAEGLHVRIGEVFKFLRLDATSAKISVSNHSSVLRLLCDDRTYDRIATKTGRRDACSCRSASCPTTLHNKATPPFDCSRDRSSSSPFPPRREAFQISADGYGSGSEGEEVGVGGTWSSPPVSPSPTSATRTLRDDVIASELVRMSTPFTFGIGSGDPVPTNTAGLKSSPSSGSPSPPPLSPPAPFGVPPLSLSFSTSPKRPCSPTSSSGTGSSPASPSQGLRDSGAAYEPQRDPPTETPSATLTTDISAPLSPTHIYSIGPIPTLVPIDSKDAVSSNVITFTDKGTTVIMPGMPSVPGVPGTAVGNGPVIVNGYVLPPVLRPRQFHACKTPIRSAPDNSAPYEEGSPGLSSSAAGGGKADKRKMQLQPETQFCRHCGATHTPEWRRGPDGKKSLCNACGLHYSKVVKRETELVVQAGRAPTLSFLLN